jgi:hypothetical protein
VQENARRIEANVRRTQSLLFFVSFICVVAFPTLVHGQQWSGIIDPSRAIDWSQAGVIGGIPTRTTICATLNPGASASQISSAIQSCPANQVVFLNAGTYNLSSGINFAGHSNATLRGAGADQTLLVFSGSGVGCIGEAADICIGSTDINWSGGPSNSANWTAGYAKGTTSITLSSTSNLKAGSVLILDQLDDSSDTGNVFVCQSTACSGEGPGGAGRANRGQAQIVTVTNVSGTTVTFSPGLYMPNWRSTQSPGAWWPTNPVSMSGIENLTVDSTKTAGNVPANIEFFDCVGCWVKGIGSIDPGRSHVWGWTSAHYTVQDSYFFATQNAATQSYGVEFFLDSDVLIQNNIFQKISSPMNISGDCQGCVFSYNYSINNYYTSSSSWQMQDTMEHAITSLLLVEGNIGAGIDSDNIHGTHHFSTYFRNKYSGNSFNGGTATTGNTSPMIINDISRYFNVIGNVLGTSGYHNNYQDATPSDSGNPSTSIYIIGNGNNAGENTQDDPITTQTLMRWGNYDTVNAAVRFVASEVPSGLASYANPVPASQALPASLYLNSKPAWFGTIPWPAIGPDVTSGNISGVAGHANMNPANACYSNIMGGPANGTGGVLTFNAKTCYNSSSAPPPNPPTNLTILVQ